MKGEKKRVQVFIDREVYRLFQEKHHREVSSAVEAFMREEIGEDPNSEIKQLKGEMSSILDRLKHLEETREQKDRIKLDKMKELGIGKDIFPIRQECWGGDQTVPPVLGPYSISYDDMFRLWDDLNG